MTFLYNLLYFLFWPLFLTHKAFAYSISTCARLFLYALIVAYSALGIRTEFGPHNEILSARSVHNTSQLFESESQNEIWWDQAIQIAWPQLAAFATERIILFLNTLFTQASPSSSIVQSITVKSVVLGSKAPVLSDIKFSSWNQRRSGQNDILRSKFNLVWHSSPEDSKIVIDVEIKSFVPMVANSHVSCVLSEFRIQGDLTVDMHPLLPRMPPFRYMNCYFTEPPQVHFKLKFKDAHVGKMKLGHSRTGVGSILSRTLRQKIIDEFIKGVVYPRSVECAV